MNLQALYKDLDRLISIPSVLNEEDKGYLYGKHIQQALEEVLQIGSELEFTTRNIDNQVGLIEFGSGEETLGILAHIDVVPAGDGWSKPPFKLTIENKTLYGRGVIDDKGPIVGILYVLKELRDQGFKPKKKIQLIIGTDEENLWRGMAYYVKHHKLPDMSFSPDASFPMIFAEKGIIDLDFEIKLGSNHLVEGVKIKAFKGGLSRNSVCDKAEILFEGSKEKLKVFKHQIEHTSKAKKDVFTFDGDQLKWLSTGLVAHGMQPEKGLNAGMSIIATLAELTTHKEIRLLNDLIGMDYYGKKAGINCEDDVSGKMTLNVGMIEYTNSKLLLKNSIRYAVTQAPQSYEDLVKDKLQVLNIKIVDHLAPLYVDRENLLMKSLNQVYKDVTGDGSEPISIGGGTYARMLPNALSFGPCFPDQEECAHEPDEHFEIDKFKKMMDVYYHAIKVLTID